MASARLKVKVEIGPDVIEISKSVEGGRGLNEYPPQTQMYETFMEIVGDIADLIKKGHL